MTNPARAFIPLVLAVACSTIAWAEPSPAPSAAPLAPPSPSPSPTPAPVVLAEGQIVDYVGSGVAKAKVTLRDAKTDAVLGSGETDELGDFHITAAEAVKGKAVLVFEKPNYETVRVDVDLGGEEGTPFVDRDLPGAIVLTGEVRDSVKNAPVTDAKVLVEMAYRNWDGKSDAEGKFRIEALPPGRARLRVDAAGFARHTELIDGLESAAALKIVLEPERIVHLEIAGDDGKPVAQANIECLDDVERDFRHMITDDAGKATIRGLPFKANALEIRLSHASYVADMAFDRTVMLPTDAAESTHKLTMSRAATLTGKVLDAATKKPLSGARLIVGAVLDDRQPKAFSDPDGAFRLEGVPPGEAVITVHLAEHSPQLEIVRLAAGQEASLDVLMSAGKSIHGVVTGPEGKKLSGAYVNATRWRNQETLGLRAITDDDGRFEILDAPTDEFEVAVYLAGFKPLTAQKIAADQKDVSFAMEGDPRGGKPGEEQPSWKSGEDAPPLTLTTLDGASWKLADLRGKVILIDFWATWCGPCVAEIPNLTAVYEQHKANPNFVMLSVSLDESDAPVRKFTKARGMSWTHAAGGKSGAQDAATAYRVRGIPAIFIIDKSGKIAAAEVRGGGIAAAVQQALGSAGE